MRVLKTACLVNVTAKSLGLQSAAILQRSLSTVQVCLFKTTCFEVAFITHLAMGMLAVGLRLLKHVTC